MDHRDHLALIRDGVAGAGPRWLELGAGDGAFTLALADLLGSQADVLAVDRDRTALLRLTVSMRARFPAAALHTRVMDFTQAMPDGPFDGVLAANCLHFVREGTTGRGAVLAAVRERLAPGGRLVVVEYDADRGNPWVPYPFSATRWARAAAEAGFVDTRVVGRVPSRFLGAIYGAVSFQPADTVTGTEQPNR